MRPSVKKLLLFGSVAPYSGALLAIDFVGSRTNGKPYYMLNGVNYPQVSGVPGWTYTGGTAAGTGSYAARQDGSLQFFPSYTNLVLQSQTFGTTWTTVGTPTISSDAVVAPDGTTTADRITSGASGNSGVYQTPSASPSGVTLTQSIYVSTVSTATTVRLGADYGPTTGYIDFNPSTGLITQTGAGITSSSVLNAGGGWYRVQWSFVSTVIGSSFTVYSKSGIGSTVVVWGAQLELGSTASTYIPTTTAAVTVGTPRITDAGYWAEEARTNLLLRSQEFDNASWVKSGATVTANQTTAPDGTTTADLIVNTPSVVSYIGQTSPTMANSTTYVKTIYVALAPGNTAPTFVSTVNKGAGEVVTNFNLSTLAITGTDAATSSLTSVGGGWYRLTHVFTTAASGTPNWGVLYLGVYGATASAANFYIWQADLQAGSSATSPIPTTSVAVTRAADVGYVSGLTGPTDGTILVTGSAATLAASPILLGMDTDTGSIFAASAQGNQFNGTTSIGGTGTFTVSPAVNSLALAYTGTSSRSLSVNGSAVTTSATSKGTFSRVTVGTKGLLSGAQSVNAPIRRVVIYPRAFGNSELQAITTAGAY